MPHHRRSKYLFAALVLLSMSTAFVINDDMDAVGSKHDNVNVELVDNKKDFMVDSKKEEEPLNSRLDPTAVKADPEGSKENEAKGNDEHEDSLKEGQQQQTPGFGGFLKSVLNSFKNAFSIILI